MRLWQPLPLELELELLTSNMYVKEETMVLSKCKWALEGFQEIKCLHVIKDSQFSAGV